MAPPLSSIDTNVANNVFASPAGVTLNKPMPIEEDMPPPPPPMEEAATTSNTIPEEEPSSPLHRFMGRIPSTSSTTLKAMIGGHACILGLVLWGTPPLALASWLVMIALVGNGVYTTVCKPVDTGSTLSAAALMPYIEASIDSALALATRFVNGEARLTFYTAIGAWGLYILASNISAFKLAWGAYAAATGLCALKMDLIDLEKLAPLSAAAQARAEGLYAKALSMVPPQVTQYKAFAPVVGVLAWMYLLNWHDKLLTLGVGLLGYKAWASPAQVDAFVQRMPKRETVENVIKKGARRMSMATMGAIEMARGGLTPRKEKPKAL